MPPPDTLQDDDVGHRIRAARLERGVSLRKLAAEAGVSASLLSLVENGRANPSVATLVSLIRRLDISFSDVLARSPSPPPRAPGWGSGEPHRRSEVTPARRTSDAPGASVVSWGSILGEGCEPDGPTPLRMAAGTVVSGYPPEVPPGFVEHLHLVSGTLRIRAGTVDSDLRPGDSYALPTEVERTLSNEHPDVVEAVLFWASADPRVRDPRSRASTLAPARCG